MHVELREIAEDEFFVVVSVRDRTIASLYFRGDRRSAEEFLEVARRRIVLAIVDEEADGTRGRVLQELMRLEHDLRNPRG